MKSSVLKFGTISGLLMALLMFASLPFQEKMGFGTGTEIMGSAGMILSLSFPIYYGIRNYRNTIGEGFITYWKALNTGILILVISAIFYAGSWLIIYYWISPDFQDKLNAYTLEQMKIANTPKQDIDSAIKQLAQNKEMLKNPFINGSYAFTVPLPLGIIISLICSAILKKRKDSVPPMKNLLQN